MSAIRPSLHGANKGQFTAQIQDPYEVNMLKVAQKKIFANGNKAFLAYGCR